MAFVGDAMRYVTSTMDASLVTPVTQRLANSVANPYVLSYLVWDRMKKLTPQRARDLTRLLSVAVTNGVGVLGAEEAKLLAATARRLQDEVVAATISPEGKDVILNSVASAAKVAQALNTPETKIATKQVFETIQSLVDFFASKNGRKLIASAGDFVTHMCEVAASPESSVFLAEVATNVCHALEVEQLRRDAEKAKEQEQEQQEQQQEVFERPSDEANLMLPVKTEYRSSPSLSSLADTAFETESNFSEFSLPMTPATPNFGAPCADPAPTITPARKSKEPNALRSARIEKDVLLKMGVDPLMLDEVQRILDKLHEEQATKEAEEAAAAAAAVVEEAEEETILAEEEENSGYYFGLSSAFGFRSSSLPAEVEPETKPKAEEAEDGVILPEWHQEQVRTALRRRHVAAEEMQAQRNTYLEQSREMADILVKRRLAHGDMQPEDVLACRVISQIIIFSFACFLLLVFVYLARAVFG